MMAVADLDKHLNVPSVKELVLRNDFAFLREDDVADRRDRFIDWRNPLAQGLRSKRLSLKDATCELVLMSLRWLHRARPRRLFLAELLAEGEVVLGDLSERRLELAYELVLLEALFLHLAVLVSQVLDLLVHILVLG